MPKIANIRSILLSAPYAHPHSLEVRIHLPTGFRTTGMVQVTLDDGTSGLGEGYIGVFAPRVFESIVKLVSPYLIGSDAFEIEARYRDLCRICDYWSMTGAARHVTSAIEIALLDAKGKAMGMPVHQLLGGMKAKAITIYGSGGDSAKPQDMQREIDDLSLRGITIFKIRARNHEAAKTAWVMKHAGEVGIAVAVDMTQNLAIPSQTVEEVIRYLAQVRSCCDQQIVFLEEALGPMAIDDFPELRHRAGVKICGGETLTTSVEMIQRIARGCYDFSQPDATVIGGIGQCMEVFAAGKRHGVDTVVHCWGGPVGMMANFHAAFAGGGSMVEWPMPAYPLRDALMIDPLKIESGKLIAPVQPGLGVKLTAEIERQFPFREDAVYQCFGKPILISDDVWR